MPAQYAHLDGRYYVNEDFLSGVRQAYPATTKKIPLGYSTYTGWTGKDEVLFTQQEPVPDAGIEGPVFQVTFQPDNPDAFEKDILTKVRHTTKSANAASGSRARLPGAPEGWGHTLRERIEVRKLARAAGGLYGYTRAIQASCEAATRRLNRSAATLVTAAVTRDRAVIGFLQTHAQRGQSVPASVLLAAYKNSMPRIASDASPAEKQAARPHCGMYGYPVKTAKTALKACMALCESAGIIGAAMHGRKAALYGAITGFLGQHGEIGKCAASSLILSSYPAEDFKFRRASSGPVPASVSDWLSYEIA